MKQHITNGAVALPGASTVASVQLLDSYNRISKIKHV